LDTNEKVRAEGESLEWERDRQLTQKQESLSDLAGGVAHRFNNLLGALMCNLELALDDLASETEIRENLTQALKAAHQAADLSRSMLTYVGQSMTEKSRIDLSRAVEWVMPLIEASLPGKVSLNKALVRDLPTIEADADFFRQIAINLVTNSWESLGDQGGEVTLSTGVAFFDKPYLRQTAVGVPPPSGTYVYLEVSDTGSGMTQDVRSRMFDPFFSTKFPGRGLGLSTVWGLVRSFQGSLTVVSEPGQGTSIRVLLPTLESSESPGLPRAEAVTLAEP